MQSKSLLPRTAAERGDAPRLSHIVNSRRTAEDDLFYHAKAHAVFRLLRQLILMAIEVLAKTASSHRYEREEIHLCRRELLAAHIEHAKDLLKNYSQMDDALDIWCLGEDDAHELAKAIADYVDGAYSLFNNYAATTGQQLWKCEPHNRILALAKEVELGAQDRTRAKQPPTSVLKLGSNIRRCGPLPVNRTNVAIVKSMLDALPDAFAASYGNWLSVGFALYEFDAGEVGLSLFRSFSSRCPEKAKQTVFDPVWASFGRGYSGKKITLGSLQHHAKAHGWRAPTKWDLSTKIEA